LDRSYLYSKTDEEPGLPLVERACQNTVAIAVNSVVLPYAMMHPPFTIQCLGLSKSYGEDVRALKDISVEFKSSDIISILGANGAGKSTLISLLAGSAKPSKGELQFVDAQQNKRPLERSQVGLVAHATLLYSDLTGQENLELYAKLYRVARSRIEEVVARCGLKSYAERVVRTYSRGMAQRTAIARAILHQPPLLLCDEPYTGLDPAGASFLSELLRQMRATGTSIILVTHDLEVAAQLSDRVVILSAGRIVSDSRAAPEAPFTAIVLHELLTKHSR
jgi:ABC-type multidrug transport system ATPase subunit